MPPSSAQRAKIHIARKELAGTIGLTDEAYRDILRLHFNGAESSSDLNDRQAVVLINLFRAKGWAPKKSAPGRAKKRDGRYIDIPPGPAAKQQRKILAMWNALGYGMDKIHARVKRQFGVERFEWLVETQDLHILITDLEARCRSAGIETKQ